MQTIASSLRAAVAWWNEAVLDRPGRILAWILVAAAGFMLFGLDADHNEAGDPPSPPEARRSHGAPAGAAAATPAAIGPAAPARDVAGLSRS